MRVRLPLQAPKAFSKERLGVCPSVLCPPWPLCRYPCRSPRHRRCHSHDTRSCLPFRFWTAPGPGHNPHGHGPPDRVTCRPDLLQKGVCGPGYGPFPLPRLLLRGPDRRQGGGFAASGLPPKGLWRFPPFGLPSHDPQALRGTSIFWPSLL